MPNRLVDTMEFESRMAEMSDRQLVEFVAREVVATCRRCENHNKRLVNMEDGAKKTSSIAGAITGGLTAAIVGIINYFAGRN